MLVIILSHEKMQSSPTQKEPRMRTTSALISLLSALTQLLSPAKAESLPAFSTQSAPESINVAPSRPARFLNRGDIGYGTIVDKIGDYTLPIPPGAVAGLRQSVATARGQGWYMRLHALHNQSDLVDWYGAQLRAGGWKVAAPEQIGSKTSLSATRADGTSTVILFVSTPKSGTDVITTLSN